MKFEFWGVRGTAPVSNREVRKYGGHTICSRLIHSGPEIILVDAGTGIMSLGRRLEKELGDCGGRVHLLLTHFHLDHIMGLPFFSPLFSKNVEIFFHSPGPVEKTESLLAGLMKGRYFPVEFHETGSQKTFVNAGLSGFSIGDVQIDCHFLHHPQGSVAYRFRQGSETWILSTDTEHPENGIDRELAEFCRGADGLVYDAMYNEEDYQLKKGWGHSTWKAGVRLAGEAGVKRLYLSHFNPEYSDDVLDEIVGLAEAEFPGAAAASEEDGEGIKR